MKKNDTIVKVGSVEDFFARAKKVADKLDNKKIIKYCGRRPVKTTFLYRIVLFRKLDFIEKANPRYAVISLCRYCIISCTNCQII